MFGMNRRKKAAPAVEVEVKAVAPAAPFIAPEKLSQIAELFETVGLVDADEFKSAVMNPSCYRGGSLEWSEREMDMRFIVEGWCGGRVYKIWATPLEGASNSHYSDELIAEVNKQAVTILFS